MFLKLLFNSKAGWSSIWRILNLFTLLMVTLGSYKQQNQKHLFPPHLISYTVVPLWIANPNSGLHNMKSIPIKNVHVIKLLSNRGWHSNITKCDLSWSKWKSLDLNSNNRSPRKKLVTTNKQTKKRTKYCRKLQIFVLEFPSLYIYVFCRPYQATRVGATSIRAKAREAARRSETTARAIR